MNRDDFNLLYEKSYKSVIKLDNLITVINEISKQYNYSNDSIVFCNHLKIFSYRIICGPNAGKLIKAMNIISQIVFYDKMSYLDIIRSSNSNLVGFINDNSNPNYKGYLFGFIDDIISNGTNSNRIIEAIESSNLMPNDKVELINFAYKLLIDEVME